MMKTGRFGRWGVALGLGALLAGCATGGDMMDWVGMGEKKEERISSAFVAPNPGKPIGLVETWEKSVAGSPDKYMLQPERIAVTPESVVVGSWDGEVTRLDRRTGNVVWATDLDAPVAGGVVVGQGMVFVGTREGEVAALDYSHGKVAWKGKVSSAVASAPAYADGKVLAVTLDNRTYAFSANTGDKLWVHATPPEMLVVMGGSQPVVDGDRVFVGYSSGELFCLALADGRVKWTQNLTVMGRGSEMDRLQDVDADPLVTGSAVFSVNHQGNLLALTRDRGGRAWDRKVSAIRKPLLVGDRLILADTNGYLVAVSARDGAAIWQTRLTDGLLTTPILFRDRVVVGENRGLLFSVDPVDGGLMGRDDVGQPLYADPVVEGGSLFLWTNKGRLFRFD